METSSTTPSINLLRAKTKKALLLYLEGFREACYLHSVVLLYRRSRKFLIRTGQCFLLNGFIILGRAVLAQKAEPDYWLGKIRQDLERINEETLNDLEGLDGDKPCTVSNLTAFQHSLDHNTSGEEEVQRIKNEHPNDACAMMNDRVKGSLEVTRAFGAGFLKQDRRDTVWPHDPHTRWSYCVTMPSWILLPHSRGSDLVAVHKQIFFSILPF